MTDREPDESWDYPQGEMPDIASRQALHLAHQAVDKFPELAKRYRSFAGPAVIVSGALVALAGVAVARRIRKGQRPEEILNEITSEEIEQAATVTSRQNRWWRMLARISRRRQKEADEAGGAV
jgi:hypothetical protein